jgi:hypothetical protein
MSRTATLTRVLLTAGAVAALSLGAAGAASAKPPGTPAIPLNNEQETTGAMGGASGFFSYEIEGDQFCYELEVEGLTAPALFAHIHVGARNVAGPVVFGIDIGSGTSWSVDTCETVDAEILAAIEASPRDYYVNVHTPTYMGGEVRGQLK